MDLIQKELNLEETSINGSENTYGQPGYQDLEGMYWAGYSHEDCHFGRGDIVDLANCL